MKYSIIIPCWNQEEYTKKCVESIRKNSRPGNYQIIAIDNGCTDKTREYLEKVLNFESGDQIILNSENLGWCKAINQGIKASNGEYVIWLNNDTVVTRGWLDDMCNYFSPGVAAVGPRSNMVMGRQNINCSPSKEDANFLIGFCLMIDRAAWDIIGPIDERFGMGGSEEMDWAIRARMAGYRLRIANNVFIHHACSQTLADLPECGPLGSPGYDKYIHEKDAILREKWGDATVNGFLGLSRPMKIAIGTPMRGNFVHRKFAIALAMMSKAGAWTEIIDCTRQIIHDARNLIVSYALEQGHDYLLWLDDDMIPPPDLLPRILAHNKDIVGALAYGRKAPYAPCQYKLSPQPGNPWMHEPIAEHHVGLRKRDAIGLSAALVKMDVFRKIPGAWHRLDDLGEDLHFCRLARQHGYDVWCDTDLTIPHIGDEEIITEETWERWQTSKQLSLQHCNENIPM